MDESPNSEHPSVVGDEWLLRHGSVSDPPIFLGPTEAQLADVGDHNSEANRQATMAIEYDDEASGANPGMPVSFRPSVGRSSRDLDPVRPATLAIDFAPIGNPERDVSRSVATEMTFPFEISADSLGNMDSFMPG